MDYKYWILAAFFLCAALGATLWWWLGHTGRDAEKTWIAGGVGMLLGAFGLFRFISGIVQGKVAFDNRFYQGTFERGADGIQFWVACSVWFLTAALLIGLSVNAILRRHSA